MCTLPSFGRFLKFVLCSVLLNKESGNVIPTNDIIQGSPCISQWQNNTLYSIDQNFQINLNSNKGNSSDKLLSTIQNFGDEFQSNELQISHLIEENKKSTDTFSLQSKNQICNPVFQTYINNNNFNNKFFFHSLSFLNESNPTFIKCFNNPTNINGDKSSDFHLLSLKNKQSAIDIDNPSYRHGSLKRLNASLKNPNNLKIFFNFLYKDFYLKPCFLQDNHNSKGAITIYSHSCPNKDESINNFTGILKLNPKHLEISVAFKQSIQNNLKIFYDRFSLKFYSQQEKKYNNSAKINADNQVKQIITQSNVNITFLISSYNPFFQRDLKNSKLFLLNYYKINFFINIDQGNSILIQQIYEFSHPTLNDSFNINVPRNLTVNINSNISSQYLSFSFDHRDKIRIISDKDQNNKNKSNATTSHKNIVPLNYHRTNSQIIIKNNFPQYNEQNYFLQYVREDTFLYPFSLISSNDTNRAIIQTNSTDFLLQLKEAGKNTNNKDSSKQCLKKDCSKKNLSSNVTLTDQTSGGTNILVDQHNETTSTVQINNDTSHNPFNITDPLSNNKTMLTDPQSQSTQEDKIQGQQDSSDNQKYIALIFVVIVNWFFKNKLTDDDQTNGLKNTEKEKNKDKNKTDESTKTKVTQKKSYATRLNMGSNQSYKNDKQNYSGQNHKKKEKSCIRILFFLNPLRFFDKIYNDGDNAGVNKNFQESGMQTGFIKRCNNIMFNPLFKSLHRTTLRIKETGTKMLSHKKEYKNL
jgi:hypothetical protein